MAITREAGFRVMRNPAFCRIETAFVYFPRTASFSPPTAFWNFPLA
jgi:hypothetical protein